MGLRNIGFMVDINGISPNIVTNAGTQGEHNVTAVSFVLSNELFLEMNKLCSDGNVLMYRFDIYDGEGGIWQSNAKKWDSNTRLILTLEERHTRFGGRITVYLVITALSSDNETQVELYSFPAILQLKNRPEGVYQDGENYESMTTLAEITKQKAKEAIESADEAENTNKELQAFAAAIEDKLKNGEFDGVGIKTAEIVNGELIITYTDGTSENLGNVKGDKGETGLQGEKGDMPDMSNYYTKAEVNNLACVRNTYEEAEYFSINAPSQNQYIDLYNDDDIDINADGHNININGAKIICVATPEDDTDVATKGYVDGLMGDIETLLGGI